MSDAQLGHEKTLSGLLTALAGANIIYGLGMLEMGVTFDYGQLVMDNEFAQMINYCVNGIPVNDETLSVDAIKEVGSFKDFVSRKETFEHMRSISHPKLIDRKVRDKWKAQGSKDIYQRSMEEARKIIDTHTPYPLSDDVKAELREIVKETERHFGLDHTTPDF
ncbi:MAG: hypothetical protein HOG03_13150 [Desulfobacula sp.]|nr:hypothetical protein [Desulfobacula sp.]MBT3485639.1 hypothetical protein [Desulfobacula sp.]MBT3805526.1 hypothetical protein [Desulfobacula sp.]MBT4024811.1 hypothetical protein [Desulfobacula sp.]MBT4200083.1 hypothetical protein [Desulfobacula sp.]